MRGVPEQSAAMRVSGLRGATALLVSLFVGWVGAF